MNVYFICTGNTCRSPMAEAILRSENLADVTVRSAGIYAMEGVPISIHSKQLIEESDMPYTPLSAAVTEENMEWANVVLTMTESHRSQLHLQYPEMAGKIFTLKEYADPETGMDISDPYGGSLDVYRNTFIELKHIINKLAGKLGEG